VNFRTYKTQTVMDGLVIRHEHVTPFPGKGEISASRKGVCISGPWPTMTPPTVLQFMAKVEEAAVQCMDLFNGATFPEIPDDRGLTQ